MIKKIKKIRAAYLTKVKPRIMPVKQKIVGTRLFKVIKSLLKEQETKKDWNNWLCLLLQLVSAYIVLFVIEALARHSVSEAYTFFQDSTHVFFYNGLMIFMTSLVVFLFRRRRLARFVVYVAWLLLGIVNSVILSSRVTPLTGPDFKNVLEAAAVVKKYFSGIQIIGFIVLIAAVVFIMVVYYFRCPRYKGKMHRIINILAIAVSVFGFWQLTQHYINTNILSTYFGNITYAYEDYGFPYCFTVTLFDTGMSEPNNYSKKTISNIVDQAKEKTGETKADTEDLPNIIIVQLESFFDVTRVKNLEMSEDPLPNWHKLCKKYTSGYYGVPTFGAGTVNTEFETLTGMSLRFFGAGEYPYKSVLKKEACESSAFVLKDLGYTCFALHDNEANFYSRKKVYKNLGFDYFISKEYMQNSSDVNENGWMKDENLIEPMMECMDSTEGSDYLFTVSVQPHGSYPTEQVYEDPEIEVDGTGLSEEEKYEWEYYVNQIHEEDQFITDLIKAVKNRDEKTIILFYGDHLPAINVDDDGLNGGTTYETNYLLWNNFGLKQNDKTMYSYQAFATILNKLKIHEGSIFTYQQSNLKTRDKEYNSKLQALQYDLLYGEQYLYSYKAYIPNDDYRLGLYDPELTDVKSISNNIYRVGGAHFTESCKLFVNDEMVETLYVDSGQLLAINTEIKEGDKLQIGVQSSSSTHKILSKSEIYMLNEDGSDTKPGAVAGSDDLQASVVSSVVEETQEEMNPAE